MGVGGWGLGIGGWGFGPTPNPPIPNPQSPIPNPHYIVFIDLINSKKIFIFIYIKKMKHNLSKIEIII